MNIEALKADFERLNEQGTRVIYRYDRKETNFGVSDSWEVMKEAKEGGAVVLWKPVGYFEHPRHLHVFRIVRTRRDGGVLYLYLPDGRRFSLLPIAPGHDPEGAAKLQEWRLYLEANEEELARLEPLFMEDAWERAEDL